MATKFNLSECAFTNRFTEDLLAYLIMEFASGGELFDYIVKYQKVDEITACRFFQ